MSATSRCIFLNASSGSWYLFLLQVELFSLHKTGLNCVRQSVLIWNNFPWIYVPLLARLSNFATILMICRSASGSPLYCAQAKVLSSALPRQQARLRRETGAAKFVYYQRVWRWCRDPDKKGDLFSEFSYWQHHFSRPQPAPAPT